MITFEHINLVVKDMNKTLAFYQAAMPNWFIRGQGKQNWYGTERKWLHFGNDFQYLAFNDNGLGENRELKTNNLGLAHFAFTTANLALLIKRFAAIGVEVDKVGEPTPYRKNAYFIDPNGYEVEFVEYSSDLAEQRNNY
ncbi:VOC family protein [Catenovulum sp. SM1970]|uniref:VOC family protein n=1 Tax=Marinifaba aquimaris TaxID=2741323 RepID=UPI001571FED8|nr:VOC family protein [Marinifaba aquimaris]NTS77207.1 VOC family protein [Marinifaba aquimaris]